MKSFLELDLLGHTMLGCAYGQRWPWHSQMLPHPPECEFGARTECDDLFALQGVRQRSSVGTSISS